MVVIGQCPPDITDHLDNNPILCEQAQAIETGRASWSCLKPEHRKLDPVEYKVIYCSKTSLCRPLETYEGVDDSESPACETTSLPDVLPSGPGTDSNGDNNGCAGRKKSVRFTKDTIFVERDMSSPFWRAMLLRREYRKLLKEKQSVPQPKVITLGDVLKAIFAKKPRSRSKLTIGDFTVPDDEYDGRGPTRHSRVGFSHKHEAESMEDEAFDEVDSWESLEKPEMHELEQSVDICHHLPTVQSVSSVVSQKNGTTDNDTALVEADRRSKKSMYLQFLRIWWRKVIFKKLRSDNNAA